MLNVGMDWGERTPDSFSIFTEDGQLVKTGPIERSVAGACVLIDQIKELETDRLRWPARWLRNRTMSRAPRVPAAFPSTKRKNRRGQPG